MKNRATTTLSRVVCRICCRDVSVKRLIDWGADAVKILLYYTPFDDTKINDIKHAFIERVGAESNEYDVPFFLECVGYDNQGGSEKGIEFAKLKPEVVGGSMKEFSKPQYGVDVLESRSADQLAVRRRRREFQGHESRTRAPGGAGSFPHRRRR